MCNPPPQGVNGAPNVPKLYASGEINISKSIEGGSMKLTNLVDYIYVCVVTNAFPCNECIYIFLETIFFGGGGEFS